MMRDLREQCRPSIGGAAMLPGVLMLLASGCARDVGTGPALPEVTVAEVISKRVIDWDEYTGRFQAVDSVDIRPRASGYIEQIMFREGQLVSKDDVLFGRVSRAEVTRGNLVTGGNEGGTLLTTLVSIDPIYVYFEGDENAYLRYQAMARGGGRSSSRDARNPVRVGLADEQGFPHEGSMDFVDNQLDVRTGTIRARAVLDNKEGRFTPGLFARVQLLGSDEYEAVLVEDRAVGTDQSQSFVLVVTADNKIEYRAVQAGRSIDGLRVIRKGLNAGDVVVTSGLQRVRPGMQVTPRRATRIPDDTRAGLSPLARAAEPP